jgi:hypothetical protein
MAASVLSIYNGALAKVRHRNLATATDNTEARRLCDSEYAKAKAWCLEQGLWNFALRTTMLESSTVVTPEFGMSYAFEKPDDFVRLNAISGNAYFNPTLEQYADEGGFWVADIDPLYVSYISNDASYGGDISRWPATFDLAVEYDLAFRIAPHLTSMGGDALVDLMKMRDRAIRDARSKDALNQPASRPPPGRLTQSRMGSNALSGRPWWR